MKYTFFLVAKSDTEPVYGSDAWKSYAAEYGAWNEQAAKAGFHRGGEPVQPPETATTIRKEGDEVKLQNGPFADTDEKIMGWYLVEVDGLEDPITWASKIPLVARGYGGVEIRPGVDFSQT